MRHWPYLLAATALFSLADCGASLGADDDSLDDAPDAEPLKGATILFERPDCQIIRRGETLGLRGMKNGKVGYEALIGAGGAISSLRVDNRNFLAPSFAGEITDRVIQSVWFREDISMPQSVVGKIWNNDYRFNVNQAGNRLGSPAHPDGVTPIDTLLVANDRCRIDLHVSAHRQFNEVLDPYFQTERSIDVAYEIAPSGELHIFKHEVVAPMSLDPAHVAGDHPDKLWLEEWIPFAGARVGRVAAGLDATGAPTSDSDFKTARELKATESAGYAVAYKTQRRGIGIVYGTRAVTLNDGHVDHWYTRLLQYGGGDVVLADPQLIYDGENGALPIGMEIKQDYFLVPTSDARSIFTPAYKAQLEQLVPLAGAALAAR